MKSYKYLVFDLDGTISDPKVGITCSLNHALSLHGYDTRPESELAQHIGPPLDQTFALLTGEGDTDLHASLVSRYRERYAEVGYAENVLYAGVVDALTHLADIDGVTLGVCSSKRVDFVEQILEMFNLQDLFSFVSGGEIGIEKWQQLGDLKAEGTISEDALMIGDRRFDLIAAHRNGLDAAGVLWGFGSRAELVNENPRILMSEPQQLRSLAG
jgi:phosphoglycolate phosphatase